MFWPCMAKINPVFIKGEEEEYETSTFCRGSRTGFSERNPVAMLPNKNSLQEAMESFRIIIQKVDSFQLKGGM